MMKYLSLLIFIGLVFVVSMPGATFQPGEWYEGLIKPSFMPPGWLFGPVWTALYVMIAVAGWLVWRAEGFGVLLAVWAVQLILNMAWSWIMFGRQEIGWALVDISLLWAAIALFIVLGWRRQPIAAALFSVYLVWVSFATAINYWIWQLNGATT